MDAVALERVSEAFQDFHDYFAPDFGRREAREHSRHYLQALLVQSEERRNAENLSETVPASSRALQRFLAESPWDDDAVSRVNYICRLASISFAGSPPWPGPVAGQRWSGSWGRQTPG